MNMKSKLLQWAAMVLIVQVGLFHILNAQAEYEEAAYMGYLFAANFFGSLIAALAIYRKQVWGWVLGLVIAIGSIAGYLWSRTLGMPEMNVEEWFAPYGIISLAVEGLFIVLFLFRSWRIPTSEVLSTPNSKFGPVLPLAGILLVLTVTFLTYRWDYDVVQAYGLHVGSPAQVSDTTVTSFADLEKNYGVQVSLIATTMMESVVDVRLKIIDPVKANSFLQNQAALLVNQQELILAPHMHSHAGTRLKAGKVFFIFFSTQQVIHPGSEVNLVIGPIRIAPVTVQ
jgi:hypothetical protein